MGTRSNWIVSTIFLAIVGFFTYGVASVHHDLWPYPVLNAMWQYLFSDRHTDISATKRIINDFGGKPYRFLVQFRPNDPEELSALNDDIFSAERAAPLIRNQKENKPDGYIAILGPMLFDDTLHGVLLIDYDGNIKHHWPITQEDFPWSTPTDYRVFPHGFLIQPDGDVIVNFDDGMALARYDRCGDPVWQQEGRFHHSLAADGSGNAWTWRQHFMVRIDLATGKQQESLHLIHVWQNNPDNDVLGVRQEDYYPGADWTDDPFHPNDVEPLRAELAAAFPGFEKGDLLISLRSLNSIIVVDPVSKRIKWWRSGLTRRQHDPDWHPDGVLSVYDNQMHRNFSRIISINPQTFETRTLLDGSNYNFVSNIRGTHQIKENGNILVASTQQGRLFEVNPDGDVVFEFINTFDKGAFSNLIVMNAGYLPADYFARGALQRCDNP